MHFSSLSLTLYCLRHSEGVGTPWPQMLSFLSWFVEELRDEKEGSTKERKDFLVLLPPLAKTTHLHHPWMSPSEERFPHLCQLQGFLTIFHFSSDCLLLSFLVFMANWAFSPRWLEERRKVWVKNCNSCKITSLIIAKVSPLLDPVIPGLHRETPVLCQNLKVTSTWILKLGALWASPSFPFPPSSFEVTTFN